MNYRLSVSILLVSLLPAAGAIAQVPAMTAAQGRLLYAAGGFPISADGRSPNNRCGRPASPKITFVDMNGDGRKEALFIDAGTCYQPDGRWYAVATQDANGAWRRVLEGPGTVQANGTIVNGWFALNVTSAGKMQTLSYNGQAYATKAATPVAPALARPANPAASAARPSAPAPQGDAAIFRAAGFKQTKRGWESGCDDPTAGAAYSPGHIEKLGDLNGDGRPEALVTEGGSFCYGNIGERFALVSQQADGVWKQIHAEVGIAEFLKTKGVGGWPDISVGGPGFCFPVYRWNGRAYALNRSEYKGKACRP